MLKEIKWPQKASTARFPLYEVSKIVKLKQPKNGTVAARGWGRGKHGVTNQWA